MLVFVLILACAPSGKVASVEQLSTWNDWQEKRMEELKSKDGYLNLVGLYWLKDGENTFGSDSSNSVQFPEDFPEKSGVFLVQNGKVSVAGVADAILIDSTYQAEGLVYDGEMKVVKEMSYDSYVWFVIEREGDIGVRLKDLDHPSLSQTIDIKFFDFNPELQVQATFIPHSVAKKLSVDNILGHQFEFEIEGELQFEVGGKSYSLEPMEGDDDFFIIFSDETSAIETYGSGRYIHVPKPNDNGKTTIDFNQSYNPPCAFSDFATCLIPPPENRLTLRVNAGELDFHME